MKKPQERENKKVGECCNKKGWNKEVETRSGSSMPKSPFFLLFSFLLLSLSLSDFLFSFFAIPSFLPSFHFSSPSSWWETKIMMMSGMKPIIGTWDTHKSVARDLHPSKIEMQKGKEREEEEGMKSQTRDPILLYFPFLLFFFFFLLLLASFFFFIPNRFVFCKAFFLFVSHCVCLSQCDGRENERLLRVRKMERKESSQKIHFHPFLCFLCMRQKTFLSSSRFSTWV